MLLLFLLSASVASFDSLSASTPDPVRRDNLVTVHERSLRVQRQTGRWFFDDLLQFLNRNADLVEELYRYVPHAHGSPITLVYSTTIALRYERFFHDIVRSRRCYPDTLLYSGDVSHWVNRADRAIADSFYAPSSVVPGQRRPPSKPRWRDRYNSPSSLGFGNKRYLLVDLTYPVGTMQTAVVRAVVPGSSPSKGDEILFLTCGTPDEPREIYFRHNRF